MEIPDRPFNKIAIDLVTECDTSTSGNEHAIPDKTADTIVSTFINEYLPVHMWLRYILLDNGMEFKNSLMDQVLQQLDIAGYSQHHTTHRVMAS